MRLTIVPKKYTEFGNFDFWMPENGGYIYLESKGHEGTTGRQICDGGGFMGNTLSGCNRAHFEYVCRLWYRQFIRETVKNHGRGEY